jgi:antirestriction protein
MNNPSIYIACLASYNNGILFGSRIDATQGTDAVEEKIKEMLSQSPIPHAEEWAIHDYDGFGSYQLHEYESIASVCEIATFIIEHGELGIEMVGNFNGDLEQARDALEDQYHGTYDSELEFGLNERNGTNATQPPCF